MNNKELIEKILEIARDNNLRLHGNPAKEKVVSLITSEYIARGREGKLERCTWHSGRGQALGLFIEDDPNLHIEIRGIVGGGSDYARDAFAPLLGNLKDNPLVRSEHFEYSDAGSKLYVSFRLIF